jgi:hypothetical protein
MNVIFTFYRNFIWPVTFITLISCYVLLAGSAKDLVYLFWMKVFSNAGLGFYIEFFERDQFYFFNNLGYSKPTLYICVALLDFALWLLASLCILLI